MRVFVIDDSPIILNMIENMLKDTVTSGIYCKDVDEMLYALLDVFKPDVILLDLNLNNACGVKVSQKLKLHPIHKNIPIIAVSADNYTNRHCMEKSNNFMDFIKKPIDPAELVFKVSKYSSIGRLFNLAEPILRSISHV